MREIKLSFDWIVGLTWGIGTTFNIHWFCIRHHDEELLLQIAETIGVQPITYHSKIVKKALRVPLSNILPQTLFQLGWTGRLDKSRKYPQGIFNELEFIRGYCQTKSTRDFWVCKNRRNEEVRTPRLRIWGSLDIVYNIDQYFIHNLQTTPKKPHLYRNCSKDGYLSECYCVQYQSKKEVPRILNLINVTE